MKHYDLIVVGGGLSGVAAAVSAAREGLQVLLVEKSGCLGGAISNNLVYPFTWYWTTDPKDDTKKYLNAGIFALMREKEKAYIDECNDKVYASYEYCFKPEFYKLLLDDLVTESGVDVLFHSLLVDVKTENRQITGIVLATVSGLTEVTSDFFIDATGNGDLFAFAGCDYQLGRESDGFCQPMTTCFRMSNVDMNLFKEDTIYLQNKYKELQSQGVIKNPRENLLWFTGIGEDIVHFNTTRVVKMDPTDPVELSKAEIIARKQIHETVRFLKEHSKAFENSTVISIATEIGVRESRKLKGVHILTQDELKECIEFDDTIALGNYAIDIHSPDGSGTTMYHFKKGEYYRIPYRSLLPKEYDNLLVAGRCISATHEAQAAIRIMSICACMGEAAGTAAAICNRSGMDFHTVDIKELRRRLLENGAVL